MSGLAVAMLFQGLGPAAVPEPTLVPPNIEWDARPSVEAMVRAFPPGLARVHLAGRAAIQCEVVGDGHLDRCVLVSEYPSDAGVGSAALSVAPYFKMTAKSPDGRSTERGTVRVPIMFLEAPDNLPELVRRDPALPEGQASVNCRISPGGAVDDCLVLDERPYGQGVGERALQLVAKLGFKAREAARIQVAIRFRH